MTTAAQAHDERPQPSSRQVPAPRRVERGAAARRWSDRQLRVGVVSSALVCAGLSATWLTRRSVWYDEAVSIASAAAARDSSWRAVTGDVTMPLYHLLLGLWTSVFGSSEAGVRSLSLLAAVLTVPASAALARRLAGRRVALIAAVVVATNGSVVMYAEEARSYALAMLLTTVAAWALAISLAEGGRRRWGIFVIIGASAAYAHLFALLAVPSLIASALLLPPARAPRRSLAWAAGGFLVLVSPLLVVLARFDTGSIAWIPADGRAALRNTLTFLVGEQPRWAAGLLVISCAVVATAWLRRSVLDGWAERTWLVPLALCWLFGPLAAALLLGVVVPVLVPRVALVSLPAAALLVAVAVDLVRPRRLRALALALVVGIQCVGLVHLAAQPSQGDWRSVTAEVARSGSTADAVLVLPARERLALEYYEQRLPHGSRAWRVLDGPSEIPADVDRVWLVISDSTPGVQPVGTDLPEDVADELEGWTAASRQSFERLTVTRYDRPAP